MTDLTLISVRDSPFDSVPRYDGLMAQVQPCVHRLERLAIINRSTRRNDLLTNGQIIRFFEFVGQNLPFLRSLKLEKLNIGENCLDVISNGLSNINEIYLNDMEIFGRVNQLELLLDRLANLQVFVYMNCDVNFIRIEAVADCLYKRFPNLKGFGCSIKQVLPQVSSGEIGEHFKFLEKFKHLMDIYLSGPVNFRGSCDIQNVIKFAPNIKRLSLYQIDRIHHQPAVIRRIATSIKEVIDNRRYDSELRNNHRLHIIANQMQCQEFRAIKNVDDFIRLENKPAPKDALSTYYNFSSNQNNFIRSDSPLFDPSFESFDLLYELFGKP